MKKKISIALIITALIYFSTTLYIKSLEESFENPENQNIQQTQDSTETESPTVTPSPKPPVDYEIIDTNPVRTIIPETHNYKLYQWDRKSLNSVTEIFPNVYSEASPQLTYSATNNTNSYINEDNNTETFHITKHSKFDIFNAATEAYVDAQGRVDVSDVQYFTLNWGEHRAIALQWKQSNILEDKPLEVMALWVDAYNYSYLIRVSSDNLNESEVFHLMKSLDFKDDPNV